MLSGLFRRDPALGHQVLYHRMVPGQPLDTPRVDQIGPAVQKGVHRQAAGYIACSGAPHTVAHDAQSHVGLGKLYVEIILILLSDHTLIGDAPYVHG